jgi:hypothetical protein
MASQRLRSAVATRRFHTASAANTADAALVDETAVGGFRAPVRRIIGQRVLAGTRLLAGTLEPQATRSGDQTHATRSGDQTQAARIARTLIAATVPTPRIWALNQDAEDFAGRAVTPTLLAGAAGLAVGGTTTALAVLRPDYATGVGLAVPLDRLRDAKLAIRHGAVVRAADAVGRLAETSWIVLVDHEALHRAGCDVAELRAYRLDDTRLAAAAAAAGAWLGDERGPALLRACRMRGLIVRRAELLEIADGGVAVRHRGHVVRLRGNPPGGALAPPPLRVEIDGVEAGGVRFLRHSRLEAAAVVRQLQLGGLRVFLTSERAADAAAHFARQLGVDRHRGGMNPERRVRLLRDLREHRDLCRGLHSGGAGGPSGDRAGRRRCAPGGTRADRPAGVFDCRFAGPLCARPR